MSNFPYPVIKRDTSYDSDHKASAYLADNAYDSSDDDDTSYDSDHKESAYLADNEYDSSDDDDAAKIKPTGAIQRYPVISHDRPPPITPYPGYPMERGGKGKKTSKRNSKKGKGKKTSKRKT